MATAKEIKRRIKSIKNTAKITKAMELISTVKMKKAQDLANHKKEYIKSMMKIFFNLTETLSDDKYFSNNNKTWKTLAIVITSNKWLCWGYNVNVMKKINSYLKDHKDEKVDFVTIWKRWMQFIWRTWNEIIADFSSDFSDYITPHFSSSISQMVIEKFISWEYDKVQIFYNHFVNTIKQVPVSHTLFPVTKVEIENYFKQTLSWDYYIEKENIKSENCITYYEIEPSKEILLDQVIPMILNSMFFDILLEAKASEHSSRMIAMKNAKDSANKFAKKLTLSYNKARQWAITKEVSEIVSWVESMKD